MNAISGRIRQHNTFFIGYLFFLAQASLLLLAKGKAASFLFLNSYHTPRLDTFFIYYTNAGDGIFAVLLSVFLFFVLKKKQLGLTVLIAYSSTGILAQIIKPLMESPRPETYFSPQWLPFFIRDIIHTGHSSFPSGHTVSAFAVATVLALYQNNKLRHVLFLLLAVLVGFSRIYLSQHFLVDVMTGSFIGVAGGIACVHWCRNIKEEKLVLKKK